MVDIQKIIEDFSIQKGDNVWLSCDLMKLLFVGNDLDEWGSVGEIIKAFQKGVGSQGTILIPTFCYDFSNIGVYDYKKSDNSSGIVGSIALSRFGFKKTLHPIHSFAVWGKDRDSLCKMKNVNSFGLDSPFSYCVNNSVKEVCLGASYNDALSFVPYVETLCNVPYRFNKHFKGTYIDDKGLNKEVVYDYPARRMEIRPIPCFERMGAILEDKGISYRFTFDGVKCCLINMAESVKEIEKDIKDNLCRNLYDFNLAREIVFQNEKL